MVEGGRFEIYCTCERTGGSNPPLSSSRASRAFAICPGEVTEWLKVHDWKSCVGQLTGGSNPPLSARIELESIVGGEGRGPETETREPRQVRKEATVALVSEHRCPRLSPRRWILLSLALLAGCPAKVPPRPSNAPPVLLCEAGTAEVLAGSYEQWCARPDGTRHGLWLRWHPSRERAEQVAYVDGFQQGPYRKWDSAGNVVSEGDYDAGVKVGAWVWRYASGRPQIEGSFADGHEDGTWIAWWSGGVKLSEGDWSSGDRVGVWQYWHPNGYDAARGTYVGSAKQDDWQYWDPDGNVLEAEAFAGRYPYEE